MTENGELGERQRRAAERPLPKRVLRMPRYYRASVLACRMGHPDPLAAWRRGVCSILGHDVFKATSELDQETAKWSIKAEERATGKQFPQAQEVASGERPYCWRCGEVLAA